MESCKFVGRKVYIFVDVLMHLQNNTVNVVDALNTLRKNIYVIEYFIGFFVCRCVSALTKYLNCMSMCLAYYGKRCK